MPNLNTEVEMSGWRSLLQAFRRIKNDYKRSIRLPIEELLLRLANDEITTFKETARLESESLT